jgi:FMN phosphatase YigB (HAD superfamily)
LGGRRLAPTVVQGTIAACYQTMGAIYEDPARCDSFPRVSETLRELATGRDLPEAELELLGRVIATHELGRIPDAYARAITRLAAAHRLGLVANILSPKGPWLEEFARAGVLQLFATTVFSSDSSSIKPSRKLFDQAVAALAAPKSDVVFVGDILRCDIGGAAAAGLATVWIDRTGQGRRARDPQPSFVVRDLLDLVP